VAVFAIPGPSVPALAIPAAATPGYPGGIAANIFTGSDSFYYLQYLMPGGTLHVVPGSAFSAGAISEASGYPYTLAVPPADGRWITGSGQILYAVVLRPEPGEHPAEVIARGRARNSLMQARRAAQPVQYPAVQPDRVPARPPAPAPPVPEGRAHNSRVQARRAAPAVFMHGRLVPS
jgi:hypothetical protein